MLALSDASIARHLDYIEKLGFSHRLAVELSLNITVDEAANDVGTLEKVLAFGRTLIDDFGVSSVVLGCAGMAHLRDSAEQLLQVPVIEPTLAAVDLALES